MLALNKARLSAIALITIILAVVGFYGVRSLFAEETKSIAGTKMEQAWYPVNKIGTSENPEHIEVGGSPILPAPTAPGACSIDNEGEPCAVLLNVPDATYTFDEPTLLSDLPNDVSTTNQDFARSEE